jgi:hypothetical protein
MTFDDDFVRLQLIAGTRDTFCKTLGMDWPPPERIRVNGEDLVLVSYSLITDDERAGMTHVARGALYKQAIDIALAIREAPDTVQ